MRIDELTKRAEQGDSNGMQDYENAFKCFAKCALFKEKYDYSALPEFARMYREGIFVEMDERFAGYLEEQGKKRGESGKSGESGKKYEKG